MAVTYEGSWDSTGTLTVKIYVNGVLRSVDLSLKGKLMSLSLKMFSLKITYLSSVAPTGISYWL